MILPVLVFVETDEEWSKAVREFYNGHCPWPGCCSEFGMGSHHVFSRRFKALRLCVQNGLYLCAEHHEFVESIKGTKRYDIIMKTMIGAKRLKALEQVMSKTTQVDFLEVSMPTSEIDF